MTDLPWIRRDPVLDAADYCIALEDVSILSHLGSLRSLDLRNCSRVREFSGMQKLLPQLYWLQIHGAGLQEPPPEADGDEYENAIDEIRAWYANH